MAAVPAGGPGRERHKRTPANRAHLFVLVASWIVPWARNVPGRRPRPSVIFCKGSNGFCCERARKPAPPCAPSPAQPGPATLQSSAPSSSYGPPNEPRSRYPAQSEKLHVGACWCCRSSAHAERASSVKYNIVTCSACLRSRQSKAAEPTSLFKMFLQLIKSLQESGEVAKQRQ